MQWTISQPVNASPAINDPTTAVQALEQIEDLLRRLGRRRLEIGAFLDPRWQAPCPHRLSE